MLYRRDTITVRLLDAFFRNLGIFLLCVIGVSSIVATALLMRSQTYVATASIRVIADTGVQNVLGMSQPWWVSPAGKHTTRFNDLMQDLRPVGFVNSSLESAKLSKPINSDPEARDPRFEKFRKNVFAAQQSNELFNIGLKWEDKQECEKIVEALQTRFIEDVGESRQADGIATVKFLDSQITIYKKRLEEAEGALAHFRSLNAGTMPESQESEIEQLANLRMEQNYLNITSQDFPLKRQAIEERLKQIKPESILERSVNADPLVVQIRSLEEKRNALIADDWKPESDPIKDIDRQIVALKKDLDLKEKTDPTGWRNTQGMKLQDNPEYRSLMQQLTELTMEERAHKARVTLVNQRIGEYEKRISRLPAAERELVEKTRDREVIQKQYQDLVTKREQAQLKANVDRVTETSKLIPQGLIRAVPTLGTSKRIILIGSSVVLGLIVGCVMILVREWMDVSLRYPTDTERLLGVPVLASLPASPDLQFPLSTPRHGRLRARINSQTDATPALSAPPETE